MLRRTRRAPKACSWCHHRKVRCDASIRGCPCTRCRQDGRPECVLRGKMPRNFTGFIGQSNAGNNQDQDTINATNPHLERIRALALEADGVDRDLAFSSTSKSSSFPGHISFTDYPFLELRTLTTLDRADLAFLAAKGCLSVPVETLLDEFVRQYFLQVHPSSPVVDEAEFWHIYKNSQTAAGRGKKISLFVFQAVIFAGSPYVSIETIRQCGWSDKRAARNGLYARVKTLYDLHAEDRPYCLAQGAVILTLHTSASEPQISSLWLTRAIQNALIIGSGCRPGALEADAGSETEVVKASMKKRLWWSIILRDRSLCLGLRRRPQVTSFDMSMGVVTELPDEADFADEIVDSPVYSLEIKRMLLKVLQEQCRLAVLLSEMITFVFASHGIAAPSLSLEQFHEELIKITRTKNAMGRWEQCSSLNQWIGIEGKGNGKEKAPEAVMLFVNFTYMYYQTARIDLAHYEALLLENHPLFSGKNYFNHLFSAGNTLRDAMAKLTAIMEYFGREGRAQNLPLSVLAYVAMPLVLTAIDLKLSPTSAEMVRRRRRLDALGEIVRHSGRVYDVTDFVTAGTNHILRLAYITSQHLFLRWDENGGQQTRMPERSGSTASSNSASSSSPSSSPSPPQDLSPSASASAGLEVDKSSYTGMGCGRANTWHEAFLRFPRAYLLISTSVDYSLAVGRLPYDNALPELVRCIPPIGMAIRLPWTIEGATPRIKMPMEMNNTRRDSSPYLQAGTPGSAFGLRAERGNDYDHDVRTLPDDVSVQTNMNTSTNINMKMPAQATGTDFSFPLLTSSRQPTENFQPQPEQDQINLDYLYIEPDANAQAINQGVTDFDRINLQHLAQGFDPLISSWVHDYFGESAPPPVVSPGMDLDMQVDGLGLA
ncbi:Zn(II)2Cys6 transcription factor [Aspergillus nidulans FGSC A4]|uniref:Zn(II)2Cys6 transcription factor (Eurofung) n=1 Tax=Emericella nidulans (strain FGSC A4 / ATCC 38163 / CBS 112.46 / NRRL 194 / M139) TaxID=227321 RepID=C8VKE2_EMENI|nr:hypothetical protein [Aspergillus nidulans FGSC A4]CBF84227.1 TPA: Putative Zn(II)2Cys6 transcription factor (Eurofung) [Aspergillus nidulans FGSC A4]